MKLKGVHILILQGCKADVVVFVTSRSNLYDYIGDLDDKQKIHMALSRSKEANIIIGDLAVSIDPIIC